MKEQIPTPMEVGRPILVPLGIVNVLSLVFIMLSPILWIWYNWDIAWKVGLTAIAVYIVSLVLYHVAKEIIKKTIKEAFGDETP